MAKKRKTSEFIHCKIAFTSHPRAPWRVSFPTEVDGKTVRRRRTFSTEEKALAFAREHEREVSDHGVRFGPLTAEARRTFDHFRDAQADLRAEGIELPTFEALVTEAVATHRRAHEERQRSRMGVAEAVVEFLSYKATRIGDRHAEGLKGEMKRFAQEFGTRPLDGIAGSEIEAWLGTLRSPRGNQPLLGPATKNKHRKSIKALFTFACAPAQNWCMSNPLAGIDGEKVIFDEPEAFSPAETELIMQTALEIDPSAVPWLALGFFSGLRPAETEILDLSSLNFDSDEFRLPAGRKTGARIAPFTPACRAWLLAQPRRQGMACDYKHPGKARSAAFRAIRAAAGVRDIHDGARHSFISYRTAELRNVAQVADECGNSPNIIRKHYREISTTKAAAEYFAIRPPSAPASVTA